ncbi:MAG: ATP-binding protein [Spirochaetes bacterium]|jgi:MinD superfamily P-loop ATPase|nr:ATP-binding protein [Spirochaetota bacterium]
MKEIVVISGKGGTGKTSITASLAALAERKVMVDCDVDASDLHLILKPEIIKRTEFICGLTAVVDSNRCTMCRNCVEYCRFNAISDNIEIDPIECEGCGVCSHFCPERAISMEDKTSGEWFVSSTAYGPMVHARLGIAESNSGKLVTTVRREAARIAREVGIDLIIADGSPGIGCPVIASLTGASLALVVVEPSVSGVHDMKRVHELTRHFSVKSIVCINKFDLNNENTKHICDYCAENGIEVAAKIPYDINFTKAQLEAKSMIQYSEGAASKEIRKMWDQISRSL